MGNDVLRKRLIVAHHRRSIESRYLVVPLPGAAGFFNCYERIRILVGSNRSSKTFHAALEVARIVSGMDHKFNVKPGVIMAVGNSADHIADPMWTKLSRPGQYKIIFDDRIQTWRSVRPDPKNPRVIDPYDLEHRDRWRDGEPLIPPRLIDWKKISWYLKKQNQPRRVPLINGWEIRFYTAQGRPKQGIVASGAWFDEEIESSEWYPETMARLVDRRGWFIWSATPQQATEQLLMLHERALNQQGVGEFSLKIDDNPYIADESKKELFNSLPTAEEIDVRYHGLWPILSLRVYPEFNALTHLTDDTPDDDWTFYVAVDPGFRVAAAVMIAVPPPDSKPYEMLVYRECYLKNCTPEEMARGIGEMLEGREAQRFIIDFRMGRQRQIGTGRTVAEHYEEAMESVGLKSAETGSGFDMGSDDVNGRIQSLKRMLYEGVDGPRMMFSGHQTPNLLRELQHQYWATRGREKRRQTDNHAVDCLEYLLAEDLPYVPPKPPKPQINPVWAMLQKKRKMQRERSFR